MSTIVVVDDDRTFRGLLQTVLEMEGYEAVIQSCASGVASLVRELNADLVLMDVHVGNGDSLDSLRELKADVALRDVPVLMTSGADHAAECLEAGADMFILKPFRPSELLAAIAGLTIGNDGENETKTEEADAPEASAGEAQTTVAAC